VYTVFSNVSFNAFDEEKQKVAYRNRTPHGANKPNLRRI